MRLAQNLKKQREFVFTEIIWSNKCQRPGITSSEAFTFPSQEEQEGEDKQRRARGKTGFLIDPGRRRKKEMAQGCQYFSSLHGTDPAGSRTELMQGEERREEEDVVHEKDNPVCTFLVWKVFEIQA